jgi:hypothetical protein
MVDTMARIDEAIYTEVIASVAVKPRKKRAYVRQTSRMTNSYRTVGKPIPLNVNAAVRGDIDWKPFHPELKDFLPRVLTRSFQEDVPLPGRHKLHVFKSIIFNMGEDGDGLTVQASSRATFGPTYDCVSVQHDGIRQPLDCYYCQVLLIFTVPSFSEQVYLVVKNFKPVSRDYNLHPKMKRIWLKEDSGEKQYSCFGADTVLDKEHLLPDFDSSQNYCFVGKYLFF